MVGLKKLRSSYLLCKSLLKPTKYDYDGFGFINMREICMGSNNYNSNTLKPSAM